MHRFRSAAFTLPELLIGAVVLGFTALMAAAFLASSARLVGRNFTTNHSHDTVRNTSQRLLADLHNAGSGFRLLDFNGTAYTDATPAVTADQDQLSQLWLSQRTNGVRYRRLAGGPYRITQYLSSTPDRIQLQFGVSGALPYLPQAGDRVLLPLVNREYTINGVATAPTTSNTLGTIVLDRDLGFTLTTSGTNITTALFFRRAAFTAWNNQLRYHPNFQGSFQNSFVVVRDGVTSPKPFALLFSTSTSTNTDALQLRVGLESYDGKTSARRYLNGTSSLLSVIPPRTMPTLLSTND
jgi:hypothetical protein